MGGRNPQWEKFFKMGGRNPWWKNVKKMVLETNITKSKDGFGDEYH